MNFGSDQRSESSSSRGDEESDSTYEQIAVQHANDPLSFNGIGTINMDNCQESHIGTRIVADNLNIILNHPKGFEFVEKIVNPSSFPQYENLDWERRIGGNRSAKNVVTDKTLENPSFSWSYRNKGNPFSYVTCSKKIWMILLGILILLMVVIMGILFYQKSSNGRGNDVTTVSPIFTGATAGTLPTDDGHTTGPTIPTSPPVIGEFISRKSWGGRDPPAAASRNEFNTMEYIALDNLQGERCSSAGDAPLNYNFLIDDEGNLYEARGWNYMSDYNLGYANPSTTVKVAFIGYYFRDYHLTTKQILSFQQKIQSNYTEVLSIAEVMAQCCRDVAAETGPDQNVICDLENTIQDIKFKNCSPCRWIRGNLECK